MPLVKLFGILRQRAGSPQFIVAGETVRIVLQDLCNSKPDLSDAIFTPDQTGLQSHVRIMLNGREINMLQGFETPVGDSDTLAIIPPIAGGFL